MTARFSFLILAWGVCLLCLGLAARFPAGRGGFLLALALCAVTGMCRWRRGERRFMAAVWVLGFLMWAGIFAPVIAVDGPLTPFQDTGYHLLGVDVLGRDMFSRLLYANTAAMFHALFGAVLACSFGLLVGAGLTWSPAWARAVLNLWLQTFLSIPVLILFFVAWVFVKPSGASLVLLLGITLWAEPARMFQAHLQLLIGADFAQVARMQGRSETAVLFREILPNLLPTLTVNFMLTMTSAILLESVLGYLGLGLAPGSPSLGHMIEVGTRQVDHHPLWLICSLAVVVAWMLSLRTLSHAVAPGSQPALVSV